MVIEPPEQMGDMANFKHLHLSQAGNTGFSLPSSMTTMLTDLAWLGEARSWFSSSLEIRVSARSGPA